MERTMIRNLSDHLGNNLLHVVSRHGLVLLLPWLAARLGPELNSALSDENKQGLTPVVLAIKVGLITGFLSQIFSEVLDLLHIANLKAVCVYFNMILN